MHFKQYTIGKIHNLHLSHFGSINKSQQQSTIAHDKKLSVQKKMTTIPNVLNSFYYASCDTFQFCNWHI